jgi:hypothetical protein
MIDVPDGNDCGPGAGILDIGAYEDNPIDRQSRRKSGELRSMSARLAFCARFRIVEKRVLLTAFISSALASAILLKLEL